MKKTPEEGSLYHLRQRVGQALNARVCEWIHLLTQVVLTSARSKFNPPGHEYQALRLSPAPTAAAETAHSCGCVHGDASLPVRLNHFAGSNLESRNSRP